jgi:hypothetical protein
MSSIRTHASRRPRQRSTRLMAEQDSRARMRSTLEMTNGLYLMYEALSLARMRRPQSTVSEAYRPARQIAMHVRREENRSLGHRS